MKEYIIPYGDNKNKDWWNGYDILNYSNDNNHIQIEIYNYSGILKTTINKEIKPKQHFLLEPNFIFKSLENETRHSIIIKGDNIYITALQGKGENSLTCLPVYEVSNSIQEDIFNKYKTYWNNKHEKKLISYLGRTNLQGRTDPQRCPLQLFITPNDPIIIQDLIENNLMVKDIWNCDKDIVEIYRHTRLKKINPFYYTSDDKNVGKVEFWMFPWELRQYKTGDCDDWAHELASYYIAAGVPNWRVRVVVGDTFTNIGHSTVYVLRDDMKTWRHTDSTMAIGGNVTSLDHSLFRTDSGNAIKKVWFSFNNEFSWRTFEGPTLIETQKTNVQIL